MALAVALSDPLFYTALPALPTISQPDIADRVLTHPSKNGELTQSFEFIEGGGNDYRRDALKGDALLKGFLTELLYQEYPQLTPGAATLILAATWSNASLARLAEAYGLHRKLKAANHQRAALAFNGDVRASLFEAHLYGVHASSGNNTYGHIKTFIAKVFTPMLDAQRAHFADDAEVVAVKASDFIDHVSRLNLWSQRRGVRIKYDLEESWGPAHCPGFRVTVLVNDEASGTGTGSTVKEARQQAAAIAVAALSRN